MKKIFILIVIMIVTITSTIFIKAIDFNANLEGYRIYVDAGHGGKDNGANYDDVLEDSINLSISTMIVEYLIEAGANVYTSRSGDYDLASNYDKNRKAKDLKNRVSLINSVKPDIFVSIHLNTYNLDSEVHGGQVFYQNSENSKLLADCLQSKFNEISKSNKKAKRGDYYLLNNTDCVGVIVECGFLTNKRERSNLTSEAYQRKVAQEIVNGMSEYFYKSS